ncbi:nucleoside triphosphate pyrophosphohydrolase [Haloferax larsenii]|uniref:Predicted house-cleaning noncanonical NTP pyrophosphatase, all-alpha NTP-PPase (MazG) superfamily n=1 Tax=Haloferax larsenii TaxID=302484 RepID=A0A1H7H6X7_HALLR|nr:nucleoside triphosphate pyrophosphohydrolase [Haloferax larsenii]SEK46044.1 Predicted house-cleaning noncanonical NTP pyrophosphatase, all-alpha NTP-PPase (MazG) superfamily [Haloferax larsenii]
MPREYDKLVRDDIPEVIRESGETPITHVADGDEFDRRLREKLVEEADEFAEDGRLEELADVVAVVDAVLDRRGEDWETIEALAGEKAENRGGFEDGVVLERVE